MSDCGACTGEENIKLCHDHTSRLEQHLAEVDSVVDDLRITMARLDKGAPSLGGGHTGSRPPINLDALDRYEQIRAVLTGWATQLQGRTYLALVNTKDVASYLYRNIPLIRTQTWAYDLLDELGTAMHQCRTATDRAADRISLGLCGYTSDDGTRCTDRLTAIQGQAIARCRTCGAITNVHIHQQMLISEAWHVQAPLPDILRALKKSGHLNIPPKRVEHWVERKKLQPSTFGRTGRPLYTPAAVMAAYWETPTGKRALAA